MCHVGAVPAHEEIRKRGLRLSFAAGQVFCIFWLVAEMLLLLFSAVTESPRDCEVDIVWDYPTASIDLGLRINEF